MWRLLAVLYQLRKRISRYDRRRRGEDTAPYLVKGTLVLAIAVYAQSGGLALGAETWLDDWQESVIHYESNDDLKDPVALLQRRIENRKVTLKFEKNRGYFKSLLDALQIPRSSQGLVFSKTSSQADWTSPRTPRALYFNDNVYVAWTPDAPQIDLISMDPNKGPIFYVLNQKPQGSPIFVRQTDCRLCHQGGKTMFWPGLVGKSVHTTVDGKPVSREVAFSLGHETPISFRWGGWYVTGTLHGAPGTGSHLGNTFTADPDCPGKVERSLGVDVKDLKSTIDSARYLSASSDVVALLVFEHQTRMHNLLTQANYETRLALARGGQSTGLSDETRARIEQAGESLLEYMLFRREAPLDGPVQGATHFSAEFARGGPRDSRGRSLRELQLQKRLFRYPCSYLVYSPAFDGLPQEMRNYLWMRLDQILKGREPNEPYARMAELDRAAVLEILRDTKPEFKAWLAKKDSLRKAANSSNSPR
jgi:hypothetical protein